MEIRAKTKMDGEMFVYRELLGFRRLRVSTKVLDGCVVEIPFDSDFLEWTFAGALRLWVVYLSVRLHMRHVTMCLVLHTGSLSTWKDEMKFTSHEHHSRMDVSTTSTNCPETVG